MGRFFPPSGSLTPPHPSWIPAFAGMTNGGRIDEEMPRMANERLPERSIPDRSPGHAFVSMTTCGLRTVEMALVC